MRKVILESATFNQAIAQIELIDTKTAVALSISALRSFLSFSSTLVALSISDSIFSLRLP